MVLDDEYETSRWLDVPSIEGQEAKKNHKALVFFTLLIFFLHFHTI
jgi:hypothetical protein